MGIQKVCCVSSPDQAGCRGACSNDYNGLNMIVDGHYSPFLKQYMSKDVFQKIEQDVADLEHAKEKVGKSQERVRYANR